MNEDFQKLGRFLRRFSPPPKRGEPGDTIDLVEIRPGIFARREPFPLEPPRRPTVWQELRRIRNLADEIKRGFGEF